MKLTAALILLCSGCVGLGERAGYLRADGDRVYLETQRGRTFQLVLGEGARPVARLGGCLVELDGSWIGDRFFVSGWRVTDGGDGTTPYVGVLRMHGSNLVLDDRTSRMPVLFDRPSLPVLEPLEGHLVMISGFGIGPQIVHVVAFRDLGVAEVE